jgi:hypothetical protein
MPATQTAVIRAAAPGRQAGLAMHPIPEALFRSSPAVRYVAVYHRGEVHLAQRPDLSHASSSESDRYEELLVNPAVLLLTGQRGDIDCGGREYVLVRYGHFFQLVHPVDGGHISVAIEPGIDPLSLVGPLRSAARAHGLPAA